MVGNTLRNPIRSVFSIYYICTIKYTINLIFLQIEAKVEELGPGEVRRRHIQLDKALMVWLLLVSRLVEDKLTIED